MNLLSRTTMLQARVLNETMASLKENSDELKLSIGETIDHMALNFSCTDPEVATIKLSESFAIMTKEQTETQRMETSIRVMSLFFQSLLMNGEEKEKIWEKVEQQAKYWR